MNEIDVLLQSLRTLSMAQLRKALEYYQKKDPDVLHKLEVLLVKAKQIKP